MYKDSATIENIIAEQTEDEILIQKSEDTNEVIGYTIIHFTKLDNIDEGLDLPTLSITRINPTSIQFILVNDNNPSLELIL